VCRRLSWDCPLYALLRCYQLHAWLGGHLLHSGKQFIMVLGLSSLCCPPVLFAPCYTVDFIMVLDKNVAAFKLIEPTEIYIKPCSCATTESILSFEYFMVAVAACKYVVRCLILETGLSIKPGTWIRFIRKRPVYLFCLLILNPFRTVT
jgi:hypothetical protein